MSVHKLQQDILRCKHVVSQITIKHYTQEHYTEMVNKIFQDIFEEYVKDTGKIKGIHANNNCPDKLEPTLEFQPEHLPQKSIDKIQEKYGLGRSEE
jgi:hypothetical protein